MSKHKKVQPENFSQSKIPVEIIPPEEGTAEQQLELTADEYSMIAREREKLIPDEIALPKFWEDEQSPESAAQDQIIAGSIDAHLVASIPAVDRQVDSVTPRGPIDITIGGNKYRNPA